LVIFGLAIVAFTTGAAMAGLGPFGANDTRAPIRRECLFDDADNPVTIHTPLEELHGLEANLIADGFDMPTDVMQLPGSRFLLVTEKSGHVVAVANGEVLDPPVLDIEDLVSNDWNEQGLLSIEPHPEFTTTCELFLFFTDRDGDSRLVSVGVDAGAMPTIDRDTMETILEVPQDHQYHQSGSMTFGPDGHLWVSIGDGGLKHPERSQDPHTLEGSILRLDLGVRPYAIPRDSPFALSDQGRSEVWAYGVRNPWRISIDPVDGLIYLPDTGGVEYEEINVLPLADGGQNLGWPTFEGEICLETPHCVSEGLTFPVYEYNRNSGCAIVGGEVYRGAVIPELQGHYFFGDFCRAWVRSIKYENGAITEESDWPELDKGSLLTSFGTDASGELYFTTLEGQLWKIVPIRG
jgi:glucose/arabinose dehydrogenase